MQYSPIYSITKLLAHFNIEITSKIIISLVWVCIGLYFLLLQAFCSLVHYWLEKIEESKKLPFFLESIGRLFHGFILASMLAGLCYYALLAMEYQIAYEYPRELISTIGFVALAALVFYLMGKWEKLLYGSTPSNQEQQLQKNREQLDNLNGLVIKTDPKAKTYSPKDAQHFMDFVKSVGNDGKLQGNIGAYFANNPQKTDQNKNDPNEAFRPYYEAFKKDPSRFIKASAFIKELKNKLFN